MHNIKVGQIYKRVEVRQDKVSETVFDLTVMVVGVEEFTLNYINNRPESKKEIRIFAGNNTYLLEDFQKSFELV